MEGPDAKRPEKWLAPSIGGATWQRKAVSDATAASSPDSPPPASRARGHERGGRAREGSERRGIFWERGASRIWSGPGLPGTTPVQGPALTRRSPARRMRPGTRAPGSRAPARVCVTPITVTDRGCALAPTPCTLPARQMYYLCAAHAPLPSPPRAPPTAWHRPSCSQEWRE